MVILKTMSVNEYSYTLRFRRIRNKLFTAYSLCFRTQSKVDLCTCLLSDAWIVRAHTSIITAIGKPLVTVFLVFINQTGYG